MDVHRCHFVDYTPHTVTATAFSHVSDPEKVSDPSLRLAIGRSNGDIEIWNPRYNWVFETKLAGSRGRSIEGLVWAGSGPGEEPRLFSIGGSTYITEWDLTTGLPRINYDCNAGIIWSIDVSECGSKLAVGCDDGSVVIVDVSGGPGSIEHELICQRQDLRVLTVKWYKSSMIVGGCADARVRCWSASSDTRGRILSTMRVDKSKTESTLVWSIITLPQRGLIVSGDSTGLVKFWDVASFSLVQTFTSHDADVLTLCADYKGEKVFSAGVDRKIHQFSLLSSNGKRSSKWIHSFNRLLHSNDIRTLAIHESLHGSGLLVSGGVERSVVVQSVSQFQDGPYKKIVISQQLSNVCIHPKNLIFMWQDQSVKAWKTINGSHKLVSKITMADDSNITDVAVNGEVSLMAVATSTAVKLFRLKTDGIKLAVTKIRDSDFDSIISGAKSVALKGTDLVVLTCDNEIYRFNVGESEITLTEELETEKISRVKTMTVGKDFVVVAGFDGHIEMIPFKGKATLITRITPYPHLITISNKNTVLILTQDNKLLEFEANGSEFTLSAWSKRNSEFMPKPFVKLEDKPEGMFAENDSDRVWIYGSTWLCFFDLLQNIPVTKSNNNIVAGKKRARDGLAIEENGDTIDSLKQSQVDRLRHEIMVEGEEIDASARPFWLTSKYRPILAANSFGAESIVVVERPLFSLPGSKAFDLPKLKV